MINNLIAQLSILIKDESLSNLFNNCFPNTLDSTIYFTTSGSSNTPRINENENDLDSFVITGDIDALWLRDSTNQIMAYLPYINQDDGLEELIQGLIMRQAKSILIDSFANSFNFNSSSSQGHQSDVRKPPMQPSVFEGKYEIDSLGAFLKLSYWYYYFASSSSQNKEKIIINNKTWVAAVSKLLDTVSVMQLDQRYYPTPYLFQRSTSEALDTLIMQGNGPLNKYNGLSRSLFRPSDDAVTFPYHIPGNMMMCVELNHLKLMVVAQVDQPHHHQNLKELLPKIIKISNEICSGLRQ